MIKYKLVNESIAQETIKDLDNYLSELKSSVDYKFDEEFRMDVGNLSQDIRDIKYYQDEPSYDFLNDFLSDDYLDIEELTFCLSGLNPKSLHAIRDNLPNTFRNRHREPINLLKSFFEDRSSIYRKLYKASMSIDGFAYEENNELTINAEVFIPWAIKKGFIEEGIYNNKIDDKKQKDLETGIPLYRLEIYKSTLPKYLESLSEPTSIRKLTLNSDEQTDGKYALTITDDLGIGSPTIKSNLEALVKTTWWKSQPESIRLKLPTKK